MQRTQRPQPLGFILIRRGPGSGQIFTLTRSKTTIGRSKRSQLVIPDPEISRKHALITASAAGFSLQDLNSTNGTTLNDQQVYDPLPLQHGDTIRLGPEVLLTFYGKLPEEYKRPSRFLQYLPILLPLLIVLVFGLLIAAARILQPQPTRTTARLILPSPRASFHAGEELELLVVGQSDLPIKRLEIWLDGTLLDHHTDMDWSAQTMYLQTYKTFNNPGEHILLVRTIDSAGNRSLSQQPLTISLPEDSDSDGVPTAADRCPDTPGSPTAEGCPDVDRDAIPDAEDACPQTAGVLPAAGCPAERPDDADGDGLTDDTDSCPQIPGPGTGGGCPDSDSDSLPDILDPCPEEIGSAAVFGCPAEMDPDGDQFAADADACPYSAGEQSLQGCPDRDGDGIPDSSDLCPIRSADTPNGCPDADSDGITEPEDVCPATPGSEEFAGCPPPDSLEEDSDGDEVPDSLDLCPQLSGLLDLAGCRHPGAAADGDNNGIADDWQLDSSLPFSSQLASMLVKPPDDPVALELELLGLEAAPSSGSISCLIELNSSPDTQFILGPMQINESSGKWEPSTNTSSRISASLTAPGGEPLQINYRCTASHNGQTDMPVEIDRLILPAEWNGETMQSIASEVDDGSPFILDYRLCENSCTADGMQPGPYLQLRSILGQDVLLWKDPENTSPPEKYNLYLDGALVWSMEPDVSALRLDLAPPCGQGWNLHLTAVRDAMESMPGNPVLLKGESCPQSVSVFFESVDVHSLPEDEMDGGIGPLRGGIAAASSSDYRTLSWNGAWSNEDLTSSQQCSADGLYLAGDSYSFTDLFDWITEQRAQQTLYGAPGSRASSYHAPHEPVLTLAYQPGPLFIHIRIEELDCPGGHHDVFFLENLEITQPASDTYALSNANADVSVRVEIHAGDPAQPLHTPQ